MHSRRAFFKKIMDYSEQLGPKTAAIRPPWAIAERQFLKKCTLCGMCITHCPQKILHYSRDTDLALRFYPVMVLDNNSCDFCQRCVIVCPENALNITEGKQCQAHAVLITICVKQYNQYCTNCLDACPVNAISEVKDGILIDKTQCLGCGECLLACPQQAISMQKSTL